MTEIKTFIKRLFKKLSCSHKWSVYYKAAFYGEDEDGIQDNLPTYKEHTLVCKECGKFKKITL